MALFQLILLIPQPIYYISVEIIKISSEFSDLYYPNGWEFVWQLLFICILYIPSIALFYMNRRMVNTCIRRVHPFYDFKTNQLYVK